MSDFADVVSDLIDIRHRNGLTVREVADRMCVSHSAVVYIEGAHRRGRSLTLDRVLRYAHAIGADLEVTAVDHGGPVTLRGGRK